MLLAYRPAPPLSFDVETLWYCDDYQVPHRQERVLPIPQVQLIITLTDASPIVIGMRSRFSVIETLQMPAMIGVVFRPEAVRRFFDAQADALTNELVPLDALWGTAAIVLRDRLREAAGAHEKFALLEEALRTLADRGNELHASVRQGLALFNRAPHVSRVLDVSRSAGLSRRRFAQLFREQVGMRPKLYCRLLRFHRAVKVASLGGEVDWTEVALAGGYSDQAHFIHEFREFSGVTPGTYLASDRPSRNHMKIA